MTVIQAGRCFIFSAVLVIIVSLIQESSTEETIIIEVGKNLTLTCTSQSQQVQWTLNGRNITGVDDRYLTSSITLVDENVLLDIPVDNTKNLTHKITITDVKLADEGNLTCHGFQNEKPFEIVYYIQPITEAKIIDNSPDPIKLKTSQSASLYCTVEAYPASFYEKHIKWLRDKSSKFIKDNKTNVTIMNATHIHTSLDLVDVSKNDNGTYTCTVSLFLSDDGKPPIEKSISVLVLDKPQVSIDYAKAVGANKIFLNWTVYDGNDPVQIYFVQYMQEGSSTFTYYNTEIGGRNTSYVLDNFQPNTNYKIRIAGKNNLGQGAQYTYHHWVKTLAEDPIFVPKVVVTGSSAVTMTISWQPPPPDLLEYIHFYELVLSETGENPKIIEEAVHQQNSRNLPYMFDNLKTATTYEIIARACSELTKSCGPWSEKVNGSTIDGTSSAPLNLKAICSHNNISRHSVISVSWAPPEKPNGKVIEYFIRLQEAALYRSEGRWKNETWGPKEKRLPENSYKTKYDFVNPNTNYTVAVSAVTRPKKVGESAYAFCSMPVTVPDTIERIMWNKIKTGEDSCVFKLYLPRISERNGAICCYRIYLVRLSNENQNRELPLPENLDISTYHEVHALNNSKGGAYIAEMFPGEHFQSEVFLGDGKRQFADSKYQAKTDAMCRKCFEGTSFRRIIKKVVKIQTTTTSKPEEVLPISPELTQQEQLTKAGNLTESASKILDKKRRRRRNPKLGEKIQNIEIPINDITTILPSFIADQNLEVFDGEIDMGSNYTGFLEIIVRNTDNSSSEKVLTSYSSYFETISPRASAENLNGVDDMSMILNIVMQVLCALILLVLVLLAALWIMHRYYSKNSVQGEEVISLRDSLSRALCGGRTSNHRHLIGSALAKPADIGPIAKADLPQAYVNRHKDTDYGFLREYEMLPSRFNDRTTKNSDLKENSHKNRYPDIKAYDQTRVKLSMINSIQGSDYINSNFVLGYKERKKFICAQGPMESTIIDFWRMIWEQHLEIIVMLTNLEEYNKAKCAKYWPEKIADTKQYGDITVTFASEQRFSDYLVRTLDVTKKSSTNEDEEERRQITQYHYLVWKDFMAPEHPHGIVKFIRQINAVYSVQRGPILVHCSAGVGRTGTLVALDSLMQQLDDEGQVSIFNTVCDLRHQRNFLVQSLKQYIFLYRALLDIAQFGNTELNARGLSATIENLKAKPNDSKEKCKLELEFEKIKSITDEINKSCSVGSGSENMSKNRSELVIPYDCNRVILTPIPTRVHSTYINASFIEGYDNSESFIITQDPIENTIGDFWRMISEQGITTLVMISEIGDGPRKCPRYWADDEIQYDHILVKYVHSEGCPYYTRREFNVTNCKMDDTIKVTQFQYNGWPTVEGEVPEVCRGIIELVDQAQKHHSSENNFSTSSPIAVHCSLGTDRSSIFVAMCILVQQLRTERKVDVCTTSRKLRSQRSMLLDTYAQYEFLHRAIANYADLHKLSNGSPTSSS